MLRHPESRWSDTIHSRCLQEAVSGQGRSPVDRNLTHYTTWHSLANLSGDEDSFHLKVVLSFFFPIPHRVGCIEVRYVVTKLNSCMPKQPVVGRLVLFLFHSKNMCMCVLACVYL